MIPKYRAWHRELQEMFRVHGLGFDGYELDEISIYLDSEHYDKYKNSLPDTLYNKYKNNLGVLTLMQSTGLLDKNGVEIFEGDIVYVTPTDDRDRKLLTIACFHECTLYFVLAKKTKPYMYNWPNTFSKIPIYNIQNIHEVIGNIYTNPGLLED